MAQGRDITTKKTRHDFGITYDLEVGIDLRSDSKDAGSQYSIFSQGEQEGIKEREVDRVMDEIKQKFGDGSIGYGVSGRSNMGKNNRD